MGARARLVLARRFALAAPARSVVGGLVRARCWFYGRHSSFAAARAARAHRCFRLLALLRLHSLWAPPCPLSRALCNPRARGARRPYAGVALPLALIVASPVHHWAVRVRASGGVRAPPIPASAWLPPCPRQGVGSLLWRFFSYVFALEPKPAESPCANGMAQFVVWASPPDFAAPAKGAGRVRRRLPLSGSCRGRGTRGASGHAALRLFGTAVAAVAAFFVGYRLVPREGS